MTFSKSYFTVMTEDGVIKLPNEVNSKYSLVYIYIYSLRVEISKKDVFNQMRKELVIYIYLIIFFFLLLSNIFQLFLAFCGQHFTILSFPLPTKSLYWVHIWRQILPSFALKFPTKFGLRVPILHPNVPKLAHFSQMFILQTPPPH